MVRARCQVSGERFEQFAGEMLDRAGTGVPVGQLAGVCFRVSDELLEGLSRHRRMHGDAQNIGGYARNRIQVFDRIIERRALEQRLVDVGPVFCSSRIV